MKMRCKRCNKDISETEFCRGCFIRIIEKRIRKTLRMGLGFKKCHKVLVMDPLTRYFAENLSPIISVEYKPKSFFKVKIWDESIYRNKELLDYIKKNQIYAALIPLTMESDLEFYLGKIFSGRRVYIKRPKTIFPLFHTLNSEELKLFCKYKDIRFKIHKGRLGLFLDKIENQYKGTKSSFKNAIK